MTTDITLPRVSQDDAAVTLVKWHVAVGSRVSPGDIIAEIESDKAVVELEAEDAGVITEIRIPEGSDDVRPEQVLAVLDGGADGRSSTKAGEDAPVARQPRTTPGPKRRRGKR